MSEPTKELHPGAVEDGWVIEAGVTCVVCPACAFTFDADHVDIEGGGYSCPACFENSTQQNGTCMVFGHLWHERPKTWISRLLDPSWKYTQRCIACGVYRYVIDRSWPDEAAS